MLEAMERAFEEQFQEMYTDLLRRRGDILMLEEDDDVGTYIACSFSSKSWIPASVFVEILDSGASSSSTRAHGSHPTLGRRPAVALHALEQCGSDVCQGLDQKAPVLFPEPLIALKLVDIGVMELIFGRAPDWAVFVCKGWFRIMARDSRESFMQRKQSRQTVFSGWASDLGDDYGSS